MNENYQKLEQRSFEKLELRSASNGWCVSITGVILKGGGKLPPSFVSMQQLF
jgi:hypothetical protein